MFRPITKGKVMSILYKVKNLDGLGICDEYSKFVTQIAFDGCKIGG